MVFELTFVSDCGSTYANILIANLYCATLSFLCELLKLNRNSFGVFSVSALLDIACLTFVSRSIPLFKINCQGSI